MKKTVLEYYNEGDEVAKEYLQYVKDSVKEDVYFNDALDWYLFRYLSPICDRTKLLIGGILALIVCYSLYEVIDSSFPLVEEKPIFVWEKDASVYFPYLVKLKPKEGEKGYDPVIQTVDEAVLKYLVRLYVTERESFEFVKFDSIVELNSELTRKRNYIEEQSSLEEYNNNYRLVVSNSSPRSPINHFGEKISKTVEIRSIKIIKEEYTDFASQAKNFLTYTIPDKAEVYFDLVTTDYEDEFNPKVTKEGFLAKMTYSFDGARLEPFKGDDDKQKLNFKVTKYRLFKIK